MYRVHAHIHYTYSLLSLKYLLLNHVVSLRTTHNLHETKVKIISFFNLPLPRRMSEATVYDIYVSLIVVRDKLAKPNRNTCSPDLFHVNVLRNMFDLDILLSIFYLSSLYKPVIVPQDGEMPTSHPCTKGGQD